MGHVWRKISYVNDKISNFHSDARIFVLNELGKIEKKSFVLRVNFIIIRNKLDYTIQYRKIKLWINSHNRIFYSINIMKLYYTIIIIIICGHASCPRNELRKKSRKYVQVRQIIIIWLSIKCVRALKRVYLNFCAFNAHLIDPYP